MSPVAAWAACPAPVGSNPAVYTPVDLSQTEVESCIDDAITDAVDARIDLPADTVTWSSAMAAKTLTADLTIKGQGATTSIEAGTTDRILWFSAAEGTTLKLEDFKIITEAGAAASGALGIGGAGTKILTGLTVDATPMTGSRAVLVVGNALIYNNSFTATNAGQLLSLWGSTTAGDDYYWYSSAGTIFGSSDAIFIENNIFEFTTAQGDGAFDAYAGAQVVFRHNTVIGCHVGWHGNDSSHGLHTAEIYRNTFTDPGDWNSTSITIRGGTTIIWGNTWDANFPAALQITHNRSCYDDPPENGLDNQICDNTAGGGAVHDGNTDVTGWPCYQQPGTTDDGTTTWPLIMYDNNFGAGENNGYFYNNTSFLDSNCTDKQGGDYDQDDHVKEERDYLNPDTCSDGVDNDGDGLTDMDDPQCSNFWDSTADEALLNGSSYDPYTCPHPLTGLRGSCGDTAGTAGYNVLLHGRAGASGGGNIR